MASGFPGSIDSFTNPTSTSALNSPSHSGQHSDLNDAVNKVETYMGLVKVIPTAATNGTVGATGTVTIGTTVSSVTVTNAFSSLYDAYKIIVTGGVGSATGVFRLTFGAAATNYYWSTFYATWGTTTASAATSSGSGSAYIQYAGQTHANGLGANIDIFNPFLAKNTYVTAQNFFGTGTYSGLMSGGLADTTSYASFTLTCDSGTMTGGSIRVYGYRN